MGDNGVPRDVRCPLEREEEREEGRSGGGSETETEIEGKESF